MGKESECEPKTLLQQQQKSTAYKLQAHALSNTSCCLLRELKFNTIKNVVISKRVPKDLLSTKMQVHRQKEIRCFWIRK